MPQSKRTELNIVMLNGQLNPIYERYNRQNQHSVEYNSLERLTASQPLSFMLKSCGSCRDAVAGRQGSLRRRQCPGKTLALMEVYLYVATTLQRFRVLPEEGKIISLVTAPALLNVANDAQKLRFIPR
ncbi:hypothetical protein MTO96_035267 [Rhipicephalus appendiculatus]